MYDNRTQHLTKHKNSNEFEMPSNAFFLATLTVNLIPTSIKLKGKVVQVVLLLKSLLRKGMKTLSLLPALRVVAMRLGRSGSAPSAC